jgi:hypothetical protein
MALLEHSDIEVSSGSASRSIIQNFFRCAGVPQYTKLVQDRDSASEFVTRLLVEPSYPISVLPFVSSEQRRRIESTVTRIFGHCMNCGYFLIF